MELQPAVSPAELSERPAPHVVSEEELNLVQTCLQRWRNEIEQDVQGWPQCICSDFPPECPPGFLSVALLDTA